MEEITKVKIDTHIYPVKDEEARRQISSEASARASADAALDASIKAEETRAKGVEQSLQTSINNESTTREQAIGTLNGKISANTEAITTEKSRAEGAEQNLNSKIAANTQAIANEQTRAEGAEQVLNGEIADEKTRAEGAEASLQSDISSEAQARQQADQTLDGKIGENAAAITTEKSRAEGAEKDLETQIELERTGRIQVTSILSRGISEIEEKIPSEASGLNQLADKKYVNDKVSTATADFKGTHNSLEDLEQVTANANDYAFVIANDAAGNTVYKRYKWVEGTGWVWEYDLNNSSFTAEQWAAIQSGITNGHVNRINNLGQLAFQDYAIGGLTPSGTNAPSAVTLNGGQKARLQTKTLTTASVPVGWAEQTSKVSRITNWNAGTMFAAEVSGETLKLTPGVAPQLTYEEVSALIALNVRVYATVPRVESGAPITIATGAVSEDGTGAEVVTELPTGGTAAAQVFTGDFADITVNAPNF